MSGSAAELAAAMAAAWNAGRVDDILALGAQAPTGHLEDEACLLFLGLAQQQTGRHNDAARTFASLTRMRPDVPAYHNNLGVVCREAGDLPGAERALSAARGLEPRNPEVLYNLGLLYIQQQRWLDARQVLLDAVELAPQFVEARLQAAQACHVCGDDGGEAAMLEGSAGWPPQPAVQALQLAAMLSLRGKTDVALRVLDLAQLPEGAAADAMQLRIAAQRVALYERNNQLADAQRALQALPLESLDALPAGAEDARIEGWSAHATIMARTGGYADAATLYRRVLGVASDPRVRAGAAFGLAAACDRLAEYQAAWDAMQTAHATQLEVVPGAIQAPAHAGEPLFPILDQHVDANARAEWNALKTPDARHSPVFIVGFPRSGTTLLEQMLEAHPDFQTSDERAWMFGLVERLKDRGVRYPAGLAGLGQRDADQLREAYWRMVDAVLPDRGDRRLVDKNPLNMMCLPMIARLFPEARIIVCVRHPCDVLLSCSMQPFRSPAFMVMCASLERLARTYAQAFEQCCAHLEVLGASWLEWRYEAAVASLEPEAQRLGRFLGVSDVAPMRDFAKHAGDGRFISTPSYADVARPITRERVDRWHAYREHFEPVLPILRPWIERFGYTA